MVPDIGVAGEEPAEAGAMLAVVRPSHWHRLELHFLHPPRDVSVFFAIERCYPDPCSNVRRILLRLRSPSLAVNRHILELPLVPYSVFWMDIHNAYEVIDSSEVRGIEYIAKRVDLSFEYKTTADRYANNSSNDDHGYNGYYMSVSLLLRFGVVPSKFVFHLCDRVCIKWHDDTSRGLSKRFLDRDSLSKLAGITTNTRCEVAN